jgi:thymidylate kinase
VRETTDGLKMRDGLRRRFGNLSRAVRNGYLDLAKKDYPRIRVIQADRSLKRFIAIS